MDQDTQITPGYLSSLWDFLASVKLTVVVLLTLATLSGIGTLIPQNKSPEEYLKAFGPFRYQVFSLLDVFDLYHAWWFQFLIVLLVVNITICSIERLRVTGKIIFVKKPTFNLAGFRRRKTRKDFSTDAPVAGVREVYQRIVAKRFSYCVVEDTGNGYAITAERGRRTRLGVYGVHLSVVVLLLGGLIGSLFGFEGFANIAEGESVSTIQLHGSNLSQPLPFAIRCDDFEVQFYDTGAPKLFRSDLVLLENDQPVVEKSIIVNDPLRYKGINIFQSSYGKMNASEPVAELPEKIKLQFISKASGMVYSGMAKMGEPVQIPEGLGQFTIRDYQPAAKFGGMAIGPAVIGTLESGNDPAQEVMLAVKFPKFDSMRRGAVIISIAQPLESSEQRYFTGLQVTHDPGVWLVYTGFILMITGCIVTFFMSHQQVVVEVRSDGGITKVMVAGTSNKNKFGFQRKLEGLSNKLAAADEGSSR
jgi:cytochrome c biogenesis protein